MIFCINLKFYSCHKLWIKRSIYVEIILITYHKLRLLGTKGYNRVFPIFFLSTLGRARGNNMKYPNTLWGMAETSFGYPSKGYPKSSWNFILLTRCDGALYKQVARDLEPETRRSNTVRGQGGQSQVRVGLVRWCSTHGGGHVHTVITSRQYYYIQFIHVHMDNRVSIMSNIQHLY